MRWLRPPVSAMDPSKSSPRRARRAPRTVSVRETRCRHRNRHRQFVCRFARTGAHVIASVPRDGEEAAARRKPGAAAAGPPRARATASHDQQQFESADRESHGRTTRPVARRREGRRQTCRPQAALAAVHAALLFLRGQRCAARPAHHRVRRRREPGFHPRHRPAIHDAADAPSSTIVTCASSVTAMACSAKRCAGSRACAATRANPRATRRSRASAAGAIAPVVEEPAAIHSRVRRLDAVAAERRLVHHPQAHRRRPCLARQRRTARAPVVWATSAVPRAASRSASAISGRAIPRSSTSAARTATRPTVTLWVWAPDAPPMDLRFYHDGLGQDTYEKQYKGGLEITYEDYEPGFGTPMGVARTSEMQLWILPATPAREHLAELADALRAARGASAPRRRPSWNRACSVTRSPYPRRRRPSTRRSRSSSTGCSTSTAASRTSAAGTASGTTATSCTPTTSIVTSGATTSAASPGTTPSSPPTCGCGCTSCAPAAPTPSASPRR